jgi:hypothetical protein
LSAKRIFSDTADFKALENYADEFKAKGRTPSAALLIWFLRTIFRLDDVDAEDAVCDRKHDEGVDALFVNDQRREIVLFQSKRRERLPATLGDTDLKKFVGSLAHFRSKSAVKHLAATTPNDELKRLLEKESVADKIAAGYKPRPIFVTNVAADQNALKYLPQATRAKCDIDLWDLTRLGPVLKQLSRDWFIEQQVKLNIEKSRCFILGSKKEPKIIYAAIMARELAKLPGIDDLRLFAQNVRLGLGNTRVNTEIVESLRNKNEHANFITFHNGLTIVSKDLSISDNAISLKKFSVCNGCQSLLSIWENRDKLTDNLEILVRIVRIGDDRRLPELIAYRTNNQNSISLRDLSSNDRAQVFLQNTFGKLFGKFSKYTIKRGEKVSGNEITNEQAGRLLLALFVGEPWSAHQKYRIFGDLENQIFSYDIAAPHIRLAQLVGDSAGRAIPNIKYQRVAKYGLTFFIVVYLIGQIVKESTDGKSLFIDPLKYLSTNAADNAAEGVIISLFDEISRFVITELNYFIKTNGKDAYDYKTAFKSQQDVQGIRDEIQKAFEKDISRGRIEQFNIPKKIKQKSAS